MEVHFGLSTTHFLVEKIIITKTSREMKQGMVESLELKQEANQLAIFKREHQKERNLCCYVASLTSRQNLIPDAFQERA